MIVVVMIMKISFEKAGSFIRPLLLISLFIWSMAEAGEISGAVSDAAERCLETVIPSLYAVMIFSVMLMKSGVLPVLSKYTAGVGKFLFGMDAEIFPVFVFGTFAGYPAGAKMLTMMRCSGDEEKRRRELFAGVCFGAGPAFVHGCISGKLYGNSSAGAIIIISCVSANVIIALVLSAFMRKNCRNTFSAKNIRISAETINDSVISAGDSLVSVCLMICAFSVVGKLLELSGGISAAAGAVSALTGRSRETAGAMVLSVLDITSAEKLPAGDYSLLPFIAGLVSFGGVCVIFQISAIMSGELSVKPLIVCRIAAAFISGGVCRVIMGFVLEGEAVPAAAVEVHREASPVPSVMLMLMTLAVCAEAEKVKIK